MDNIREKVSEYDKVGIAKCVYRRVFEDGLEFSCETYEDGLQFSCGVITSVDGSREWKICVETSNRFAGSQKIDD